MMTMNAASACIFEKTQRGREEIATRKYGLGARLRWLLVLIDGKTPKGELLQKVSSLGLDEGSIVELMNSDFIEQVEDAPTSAPTNPAHADPSSNAAANSKDSASESAHAIASASANANLSYEKVLLIKSFFNETIKSAVGLRGISLQLKVERAATLQEFRDLREPYFEAVLKAKGKEMAISLRSRLDQHLGLLEKAPTE